MRAAVAIRPQSSGAHNLLGFYLHLQGNLDEAIGIAGKFLGRSFPTAIEIRPVRDLPGTPTH